MPYLKIFCLSSRVSQNGLFTHVILTLIYQINIHWTFSLSFYILVVAVELKSTFKIRNESIALRNVELCFSLCGRCVSPAVIPLHLSPRNCDIKYIPWRHVHTPVHQKGASGHLELPPKGGQHIFIEKDKFDYTVFNVKSKTCISFALNFWQSASDSNANKF